MPKNGPKAPRRSRNAIAARYGGRDNDPAARDLPPLAEQHQLFVASYVQHFNAARAARDASYSHNTARTIGWELLTRPDVQAHIRYAKAQLGELHFDLHDQIIGQLRTMLLAEPTRLLDADGNLTDPDTWEEPEKLLLEGLDVEERMQGEGDGAELVRTKKVKLASRLGILDRLAKIGGMYVDKKQVLGKDGKPVDPTSPSQVNINVTFAGAPPNAHRAGQKPPERKPGGTRKASARKA